MHVPNIGRENVCVYIFNYREGFYEKKFERTI